MRASVVRASVGRSCAAIPDCGGPLARHANGASASMQHTSRPATVGVRHWAVWIMARKLADLDVQVAQLLLSHRRRRLDQQILCALRLRESDHVADLLDAGHQRDEPVEAEGDAAVRRRAVLQRFEQKAELLPLLL